MDARGLAARLSDAPAGVRRVSIVLLLLATFGIAWWSLTMQSPGLPIALWWPAAGVAAVAVLVSRGRRIIVLLAIAALIVAVNLLWNRPLDLSLAYGLASAIEVWVVVVLLTRARTHARFVTLFEIGRFLVSAGAGALVFSLLAATAAALVTGADFATTAVSLMTSHGSALFVITPLALVPLTVPLRVPRWEPVVQTAALIMLTAVVFAPAENLALTFLIITTLMWGAYRLPPLVPAVQTLMLALVATATTANGIGPFAALLTDDVRGAVFALQLFLMTHAAAGLFVAGQSADWRSAMDSLERREAEAQNVADELRQLNTQKDDFISAVSHELRTPVTSIIGFSEQLEESALDDEGRQATTVIARNARRLSDVIEDVLELSRLTTQGAVPRPVAEVELVGVLRRCIDDARGLDPARAVNIRLDAPAGPVEVRSVEADLLRVIANLLSNAVKFSDPGGSIVVVLEPRDEGVEIRVHDEGMGIPPAELDSVWDRFYRVQTDEHRAVPGTGLGLPIVRGLLQSRLGGSIELYSDGTSGTTAAVRLPWSLPDGPTQRG